MHDRQWLDRSQPQTLLTATVLSYITAVFAVLGILGSGFYVPIEVASIGCGLGCGIGAFTMANGKRTGYLLTAAAAAINVLVSLDLLQYEGILGWIDVLFAVALIALLMHRDSRRHVKIWLR